MGMRRSGSGHSQRRVGEEEGGREGMLCALAHAVALAACCGMLCSSQACCIGDPARPPRSPHPPARSPHPTRLQDRARDSLENLAFGLCRFFELTGRYPDFVVVVGYDFKQRRFRDLHRTALRLPAEAFRYEGTPALNAAALKVGACVVGAGGKCRESAAQVEACWQAAVVVAAGVQRMSRPWFPTAPAPLPHLQGEEATVAAFEADPYGCSPDLQSKRQQRDPFAAGGYNGDRWGGLEAGRQRQVPSVVPGGSSEG